MNKQAFNITPKQTVNINVELSQLSDWKEKVNYAMFRTNQLRYESLTGQKLAGHEVITTAELQYFEEAFRDEEITETRLSTLNQLFIKTLQTA